MVETPTVVVESDPARLHDFDDLVGDVGRSRCRVLDREQFVGNP